MAGTATNFSTTTIKAGTPGQLWANVAVPGSGARLTLHTDGTPDSTANPNAVHLGMTKAGATFTVKPAFTAYNADEFRSPIKSSLDAVEAVIEAEILQVEDFDILEQLTQGFATLSSGSGYEQLTFGVKSITYVPVALIWPTEADPTKFAVMQLYKTINEAGLEAIQIARQSQGACKVMFRGHDITSRVAADVVGSYWKQV